MGLGLGLGTGLTAGGMALPFVNLSLPSASNLVYYFDPDDLANDGTNSAATANWGYVSTIVNRGSGGNTADITGATNWNRPKLSKGDTNGRNLLICDGNGDNLQISNSTTGMGFINNTMTFEAYFVLRADCYLSQLGFLGCGQSSTNEGFTWQFNTGTPNALTVLHFYNGGTTLFNNFSTIKFIPGQLHVLNMHCNGTTFKASLDGGTEESAGAIGTKGSATLTNPVHLGCSTNNGDNALNYWRGAYGKTLIYSVEHSAGTRSSTITALKAWYGY